MGKRTLARSIICLGILAFLGLAALAQDAKDGVITINGGQTVVYMRAPSYIPSLTPSPESKLVKIYSNPGTGKNVYNGSVGNGVVGPKAGQDHWVWVGNGFRPKADHTVTG